MIGKNILCAGEVLWDSLPDGLFLGGAPFNVACHLQMLGYKPLMISRIGEDVLGDQIIRRMAIKKLDDSFIQRDKNHKTGLVNVEVDQRGNATYDIVNPSAWDFIEFTDEIESLARHSSVLVFGSLAQRNQLTRETIKELCGMAETRIFDINLRPPYDTEEIVEESLSHSDIVKLNDQEINRLSEWFDFPKDSRRGAKYLADKYHCNTVCITRGNYGSAIYRKTLSGDDWDNDYEWHEDPGYKVQVKDTVGSGDAFLAALISGLLENKSSEEILSFANAVGAFVATKDGATPKLDLDMIELIQNARII